MEKAGESYSTARAALLAEEPKATEGRALTMSDKAIRRNTEQGWKDWFDLARRKGRGRATALEGRAVGQPVCAGRRVRKLKPAANQRNRRHDRVLWTNANSIGGTA
jgi:hypothetical protein